MKHLKSIVTAFVFLALIAGTATSANASVMTFNTFSNAPSYSENGLTVTTLFSGGHLHLDSGFDLFNHDGGCCSDPYQFTKTGGGNFSFDSFYVNGAFGDMTFTTNNGDVYTVSNGFTGLVTLSSLFDNVSSVTWDVAFSGSGSIDNVTFDLSPTQVPEPASVALLGLGLLSIVASRRKLEKKR